MNLITDKEWRELGEAIVNATVNLIKNLYYFKNKPYSKTYKELKIAGQVHPHQVSRSGIPDLTLTGEMLSPSSFGVIRADNTGVLIGFKSYKMARRKEKNANLGRDMMPEQNGGILPPVDKVIEDKVVEFISKNLEEFLNGTK